MPVPVPVPVAQGERRGGLRRRVSSGGPITDRPVLGTLGALDGPLLTLSIEVVLKHRIPQAAPFRGTCWRTPWRSTCSVTYATTCSPDGSLPYPLPEPTHDQVAPAVEFMLAAIPQMQGPELTATVDAPLVLEFTG